MNVNTVDAVNLLKNAVKLLELGENESAFWRVVDAGVILRKSLPADVQGTPTNLTGRGGCIALRHEIKKPLMPTKN